MRTAIKCLRNRSGLFPKRARSSQRTLLRSLVIGVWIAFSGGIGFTLGALGRSPESILHVRQTPPFEYYLSEKSFSEVENTKAALQALATDSLTEIRVRHDVSALGTVGQTGSGNRLYAAQAARAIQQLEGAIEEFAGTEQEGIFVQELLWLLKKEKQHNRWLDIYLNALYRHPTHPLINWHAKDARRISDAVGRPDELTHALYLLAQIPPEFLTKDRSLAGTWHALQPPVPLAQSSASRPASAE